MTKLVGEGGATPGVAAGTAFSSEPGRGMLGTDTADVPGSLTLSEYERAKRLFDATSADWPDEERIEYVKGVMQMLAMVKA